MYLCMYVYSNDKTRKLLGAYSRGKGDTCPLPNEVVKPCHGHQLWESVSPHFQSGVDTSAKTISSAGLPGHYRIAIECDFGTSVSSNAQAAICRDTAIFWRVSTAAACIYVAGMADETNSN